MKSRRNHFSPERYNPWIFWVGMMLAAMLVVACGKKGPLYITDAADIPARSGAQTVQPVSAQPREK